MQSPYVQISHLEEKDLVYFKTDTSFWINEHAEKVHKIKAGSIGLVLENSFGSTYKERYISLLINSKAIKIYLSDNYRSNYSKQMEIIK